MRRLWTRFINWLIPRRTLVIRVFDATPPYEHVLRFKEVVNAPFLNDLAMRQCKLFEISSIGWELIDPNSGRYEISYTFTPLARKKVVLYEQDLFVKAEPAQGQEENQS